VQGKKAGEGTPIRAKRAAVVAEVDDWEALRERGRAIKAATMAALDQHLVALEAAVIARGGQVHWARDANEANRIVVDLVRGTGAREVVKVKSMATAEIGLNTALADVGINAIETDLAELIVQLGRDRPSHILVPAIHRNRAEIRDIFRAEMPGVDPTLSDLPADLAAAARAHLRSKFLSATVAVNGANFAVADTEADVVLHAGQTGDLYPHHMDAVWCAGQPFKQRIVHGTLVMSIAVGMTAGDVNPRAVSYGYDKVRFIRPVFLGDTITVKAETTAKRDHRRSPERYGCLEEHVTARNQGGEAVLSLVHLYLVEKRPVADKEET
jgi:acyl dehydratase